MQSPAHTGLTPRATALLAFAHSSQVQICLWLGTMRASSLAETRGHCDALPCTDSMNSIAAQHGLGTGTHSGWPL